MAETSQNGGVKSASRSGLLAKTPKFAGLEVFYGAVDIEESEDDGEGYRSPPGEEEGVLVYPLALITFNDGCYLVHL